MIYFKGRYRPAVGVCPFCGKLICYECSVELQPGIRVCLDCYKKLDHYFRKYPILKECYSRYLKDRKPFAKYVKA